MKVYQKVSKKSWGKKEFIITLFSIPSHQERGNKGKISIKREEYGCTNKTISKATCI